MVGERLERSAALTGHVKARKGPGKLAARGRPARDEVREAAQLVLDLGLDEQRLAARPSAPAERHNLPLPGVEPRPGRRPERVAPLLEQAQRAEQSPEPQAGAADRRDRRRVARNRVDRERMRPAGLAGPDRVVGRILEPVALHQREPFAELHLGRMQIDSVQRRHDRRDRTPGVELRLELVVGMVEALEVEREVTAVLVDAREEDPERRVRAIARVGRDAALAASAQIGLEAAERLQRTHGGRVCRQTAERADPLADVIAGERAVAVEGGPLGAAVLDDFEWDVEPAGAVGGQLPGSLLDERP